MSYQVIARKYRPRRFSEVVGQEHVTQTLSNAIEQNRIAHAYLFVGPRGTGKTTIARIFAKCLNCTGGPKSDFPDEDERCREITEGRSLDVLEIDGASNRGIDEIRELRETVKYAPANSKYKIYIVDEVHMLTKEAFNALLKTLEEPPEHVKFMFATTEPEKVLPTILSRCQRFDLRRIPSNLIVKHLTEICEKEGVEIDEPALFAIARGAEGGMRDAESTLDQLISFCGKKIQESDVLSMFGLAARGQLLDLSSAILAGDAPAGLKQLNDLARNGKDLGRLLSDLLSHFRNLMIFQVSQGDLSLMDVPESEAAILKDQSSQIQGEPLRRVMEALAEGEARLRDAASKRIFLEITLLKAIEARNAVSLDAVLRKLQQLRSEGGNSAGTGSNNGGAAPVASRASAEPQKVPPVETRAETRSAPPETAAAAKVQVAPEAAPLPSAPERTPSASSTPQPIKEESSDPSFASLSTTKPAAPAQTTSPADVDIEKIWAQLVEAVGKASGFVKTYLIESHPISLQKPFFTLGFDPMFKDQITMIEHSRNRAIVETKLHELGYRDYSLKFVVAPAPANRQRIAPSPSIDESPAAKADNKAETHGSTGSARSAGPLPATASQFSKEDFKNDPLIKKALEIFKGTIVEVRA